MPLLALLGILIVWGIIKIYEDTRPRHVAHTPETLEKMRKEMSGKSERECQRILDRYRNIK